MMKMEKKHKIIIGLLLVVTLLFITGISYSSWVGTLSLKGLFTTGNFSVEFGDENKIEVILVDVGGKNNINGSRKITGLGATRIDDEHINLRLEDGIINDLKTGKNMLQIKYPLKITDDSTVENIKPVEVDFNKPYDNIGLVHDYVQISLDNENIDVHGGIDKNDYKINFNIYRAVEMNKKGNYAVVFLEVDDFDKGLDRFTIDYDDLTYALPAYSRLTKEDNLLRARLKTEYQLEIPIVAEQFNDEK